MNHNDRIEFNGKKITIGDLWKKSNKEIVIGLYLEVKNLKDIPKKVEANSKGIANLKGSVYVAIPLISIIVGLVTYFIFR